MSVKQAEIAGWLVSVDTERTRTTYESIAKGGWEICGCAGCRNFGAVVRRGLPPEVLAFFRGAGIDPLKDAEVYELGKTSSGMRAYGGEYYFWGKVEKASGELSSKPKFRISFASPGALVRPEFRAKGAVRLLFDTALPWVLQADYHPDPCPAEKPTRKS